jgi:hypothetical protein
MFALLGVEWDWAFLYFCVKWSYCRSEVRLNPLVVLPQGVLLSRLCLNIFESALSSNSDVDDYVIVTELIRSASIEMRTRIAMIIAGHSLLPAAYSGHDAHLETSIQSLRNPGFLSKCYALNSVLLIAAGVVLVAETTASVFRGEGWAKQRVRTI